MWSSDRKPKTSQESDHKTMIPLKAPSPSPLTFSLALLFPLAAYAEGDLPGIEAVRAAKAPVIDGVLNDACWRGEPTLRDFRMAGDPAAAHPEQTQGWICYGKANLYLAFRCRVHDAGAYRKRLAESPGEVKSGIRVQIDWKNARAPNLYEEYLLNGNGTTGYLFNPGTGRGRKVRPIDELKIDALIPASVGFMSPFARTISRAPSPSRRTAMSSRPPSLSR